MSVWFLQRFEGNVQSEVGPLQPKELLELVRKGDIKPETMLRKNDSAWFPAKEVGGLFEAAYRPVIVFYCPGCGKKIPKPPVSCRHCLRDVGANEAREVKTAVTSVAPTKPQPTPSAAADEGQRSVQNWLKKKVARKQK
ncbi:GYF domain-containing protein [Roseiconus lacunae]|uniref:GYF domain-containing protein n=1 Tax=Roseiconus lacunae TaxID=2605694 RepID=A0ABT7PMB1_9BACT|nr:GYF domain-containing protein [Roseiconus lacunae]MCD0461576.1 DUF4339 domain-containing protein [Roseiconus lacunae]MDM4017654.1 GYF domain-containing protein [Roseiconus lacunae]WRQ51084.1 GYF domain-containing protein [Stieleria sp. HD01]